MQKITFNEPEPVRAPLYVTDSFLSTKEISGTIEIDNGKTVSFRVVKDADGINFYQSAQPDEELWQTIPQMEFLQRNFDIFHVYLSNLFLAK